MCKNAGRCLNDGNSHKCECQPGYTGSYCDEMVDECKSNPCRNGATCKDYQGTYECIVSEPVEVYLLVLSHTLVTQESLAGGESCRSDVHER